MKLSIPLRRERGIALIEVMIAVLLLGIGILGTIGLQARSYAALADTGLRAEATIAADRLVGIMSADQANLGAYAVAAGGAPSAVLKPWHDETSARIPTARISVTVVPGSATAPAQVTVKIDWKRKDGKDSLTGQANTTNSHSVTSYIAPSI